MYTIVKHFDAGSFPIEQTPITSSQEENLRLIHTYTGQALLRQLHQSKKWLNCSCNIPTTVKYVRAVDEYYLVRVKDRGEHDKSCLFSSILAGVDGGSGRAIALREHSSFSFAIKITDPAIEASADQKGEIRIVNRRSNKLFSLMATLLERAQLNRVNGKTAHFSEYQQAITETAATIKLAGLPLSEHIFVGVGNLAKAKKNLVQKAHLFNGANLPHAIIIGHCLSLEKDENKRWFMTIPGKNAPWKLELPKQCNLSLLNDRFATINKDLLVIMVITNIEKRPGHPPTYAPSRVFFAPVSHQSEFCLIDDDDERVLIKLAYRLIKSEKNPNIFFEKPLFAKQQDTSIPIIADFVLHNHDKKHAIILLTTGAESGSLNRQYKTQVFELLSNMYDTVTLIDVAKAKVENRLYEEFQAHLTHLIQLPS